MVGEKDTSLEACKKMILDALAGIDRNYYSLQTASNIKPIIRRERIFCYELYHRMRCIQEAKPEEYKFKINAEPDKRGHSEFNGENPDFIFHQQETMNNNLLVLEAKTHSEKNKNDIEKDFLKLKCFIQCYMYKWGAFLYFGGNQVEFSKKMKVCLLRLRLDEEITKNKETFKVADRIYLLCRKDSEDKSEMILLSDMLREWSHEPTNNTRKIK